MSTFTDRNHESGLWDLVVIGGGLAGLTAASLAARDGLRVIVLEKSRMLGGRAATTITNGVHFNLGAHALYCDGEAFHTLKELGVPFHGAFPNPGRGLYLLGEKPHLSPQGIIELLASPLYTLREKWLLAKLPRHVLKRDPRPLDNQTASQWVRDFAGNGHLADTLHTFLRLTTFVNDPNHLSAGAAVEQMQRGLRGNVWYLDGGWQTLVDGLETVATSHGAVIHRGAAVERVECHSDLVTATLRGGMEITARTAIIAATPRVTAELLELSSDDPLTHFFHAARPAYIAALDVALTQLSRPDERFTLGLDRPIYFSVHSSAAKLADYGVAVVHLMKYLGPEKTTEHSAQEQELDSILDALQPGWREHIIARRFLPNMVATSAIPTADMRGTQGRPGAKVARRPGVFLAGDWVGPTGQLSDASVASAEVAAREAIRVVKGSQASVELCR